MNLKNYFDYLYYRITTLYTKWDGNNGINGILMISLIQLLLICDVVLPIMRIWFTFSQISPYSKTIAIIGVMVLFALIIYNYIKYNHKYDQLKIRWENETQRERMLKGVFILTSLVLPWIPIILLGIRR